MIAISCALRAAICCFSISVSCSFVNIGGIIEVAGTGIHDLDRVLQLFMHFNIAPLVCINKFDINRGNAEKIVKFCRKNKAEVVGKIPFDPIVTEAMVDRKTVVEHSPNNLVSQAIEATWKRVLSALDF